MIYSKLKLRSIDSESSPLGVNLFILTPKTS